MASSQRRAQEAVRRKGDTKCPHHRNKDVLFKCHDCDKLVCSACVTSIHKKHDIDEISEVIPDAKCKILNYVTSTEQNEIPRIKAVIQKGEENRLNNRQYYKKLIGEIEIQRDILKFELDETANDLIQTCHDLEQRSEDVSEKHETDLQTMIDELNLQIQDFKDALQSNNNVLVCDISTDIPTKYKDIPATESNRLCNKTSQIEEQKRKWLNAVETLKSLVDEFMENQEKCLMYDQFEHRAVKLNGSIITVAIELGTTFSDYAFSTNYGFNNNPLQLSRGLYSVEHRFGKTSTCILFDQEGSYSKFGFEAEDRYWELVSEKQHEQWYYFKGFDMDLLAEKDLNKNTKMKDENRKTMTAMKVFTAGIKYLKDSCLDTLIRMKTGIYVDDIQWVLTVPANSSASGKRFLRESAEQAGIAAGQLLLVLEPEAAGHVCKHLSMSQSVDERMVVFKPGSKHIVLDAGARTNVITVHEVQWDGSQRMIHLSTGGDWGSSKVDDAFGIFLSEIVGSSAYEKFCREHEYDMLELYREFEAKKSTIKRNGDEVYNFHIPAKLNECCKSETGKGISEQVEENESLRDNCVKVHCVGSKLCVKSNIIRDMFKEASNHIVDHLNKILRSPYTKNVGAIVMIGKFSKSPVFQEIVKQNFKQLKIIIPHNIETVVLGGAVIYGHEQRKFENEKL